MKERDVTRGWLPLVLMTALIVALGVTRMRIRPRS